MAGIVPKRIIARYGGNKIMDNFSISCSFNGYFPSSNPTLTWGCPVALFEEFILRDCKNVNPSSGIIRINQHE